MSVRRTYGCVCKYRVCYYSYIRKPKYPTVEYTHGYLITLSTKSNNNIISKGLSLVLIISFSMPISFCSPFGFNVSGRLTNFVRSDGIGNVRLVDLNIVLFVGGLVFDGTRLEQV